MRAHHRPHDTALGAAIGTNGDDVDQHAVAVHGVADGVRGDEDIPRQTRLKGRTQRAGVGDNKAKAVAVHGETSNDQVLIILAGSGLRQSIAIRIKLNQFAGSNQFLESPVKLSASLAMQAEFAHELLESSRALRLAGNVFQDGGVGKHGSGQLSAVSSQHKPEMNRLLRSHYHQVSPPPRGGHTPSTRRIIAICPT